MIIKGRAEVDMVIKKPNGEKYDIDGKLYDEVTGPMLIYIHFV